MAGTKSSGDLRKAFKGWALRIILADKSHPLRCLVDADRQKWHQNMVRSLEHPSVDAGHLTSRWTGAEELFAIEETDRNRVDKNENPRMGVSYIKTAVLIGGIPVETGTANMLVKVGLLDARIRATASASRGALYKGPPDFGFSVD